MRRSFFWKLQAAIEVWKLYRAWKFEMPVSNCWRIAQSLYERERQLPPSNRRSGTFAAREEFKALSGGFK